MNKRVELYICQLVTTLTTAQPASRLGGDMFEVFLKNVGFMAMKTKESEGI